MKFELTEKEQIVLAFFLGMLALGTLIYVVRHTMLIETAQG